MSRVKGFTLIELIIVIVVLGILAVTAAPQFINFAGDARVATLNQLKASVESAGTLIYAKSSIAGQQRQGIDSSGANAVWPTVSYNGTNYDVVYGYPAASANGIIAALNIEAADWDIHYSFEAEGTPRDVALTDTVVISPRDLSDDVANDGLDYTDVTLALCYVSYRGSQATATRPTISIVTSGC